MLKISSAITVPDEEVQMTAIRAQGAGGQNVNKVSSAIHLRFDIHASSLPEACKQRLLALGDRRISREGIIVIKAQQYRTQEKNREDALQRLKELIQLATLVKKSRRPTRPSKRAKQKRTDTKTRRGRVKSMRGRVVE